MQPPHRGDDSHANFAGVGVHRSAPSLKVACKCKHLGEVYDHCTRTSLKFVRKYANFGEVHDTNTRTSARYACECGSFSEVRVLAHVLQRSARHKHTTAARALRTAAGLHAERTG